MNKIKRPFILLILSFIFINSPFINSIYAQMYIVRDSITPNGQNCKMFLYPNKSKSNNNQFFSYLFIEKRTDISLGCEVYKINESEKIKIQDFNVAAYTKDESNRMNYNSILPYISLCQAGKRIIMSFECSYIVINPDKLTEKIEETEGCYGEIINNIIELKKY